MRLYGNKYAGELIFFLIAGLGSKRRNPNLRHDQGARDEIETVRETRNGDSPNGLPLIYH